MRGLKLVVLNIEGGNGKGVEEWEGKKEVGVP